MAQFLRELLLLLRDRPSRPTDNSSNVLTLGLKLILLSDV